MYWLTSGNSKLSIENKLKIYKTIIVEVVTTSTKTPHLVFLVFSSAEVIDSI